MKSRRHIIVMMLALVMTACTAPVVQPIPFNHKAHTGDVACETCHEYVYDRPTAGYPTVETCMGCHESDAETDHAAKAHFQKIVAYSKAGEEIPWVRIYKLPHHVYYSHRRHTTIAELECKTCHGDIGQSTEPPGYPIAKTLDMQTCMNCHKSHGMLNDCSFCHR